jgi:hypothetical protein
MSPIVVGLLVFACALGASLLGMALSAILPQHLLCGDTKDVVRLTMGLVATMTALVLGLLVASAKGVYDNQKAGVTAMAAKAIVLDRLLSTYSADTAEIRAGLRSVIEASLVRMWPQEEASPLSPSPDASRGGAIYEAIEKLSSEEDVASLSKWKILDAAVDLSQTQWLVYEQANSSVSTVLLVVVVFWLMILFLSFSLFAPRNATVVAAMIVAALSVSTSLFLVMEFDGPFNGLIRISSAPVIKALHHVGQ